MSLKQSLKREFHELALASAYFGVWIGALVLLKKLVLLEYKISFRGLSVVVVGTLVLSKVVLILAHVPLGAWVRTRAAWVEILVRTALYSVGVFVVLLVEKAFEGRHEHGGFGRSLASVFQHPDIPQVFATTICVGGALLGYNMLSAVRRQLGAGSLRRIFLRPLSPEASSPR